MISNLAFVHPEAKIGKDVIVEPFAYIAGNVIIGEGTWIGPNATILDGARIGKTAKYFLQQLFQEFLRILNSGEKNQLLNSEIIQL